MLCMPLGARTLSWNWWPTGINEEEVSADSIRYLWQVSALSSSGRYAPYQLQANQEGAISAAPHSGNLTLGITKAADSPHRWWDYDFAVTLSGRLQSPTTYLPERLNTLGTAYTNSLYAHVRLLCFDLAVGVRPWLNPCGDPLLTSGHLLLSHNAHPLPQLTIGIEQYTPLPGAFGYIELRGALTQAFFADDVYITGGMLHYKYVGARVGGKLPVNLRYEFHHAAQWGGYSPRYGDLGNDLSAFMAAFLARAGGSMSNDRLNAQGNHLGHQLIQLDVKGDGWIVSGYWQNLFEDNPAIIGLGNNLTDGIWGICASQTRWPFISGISYEYINTTDQSGPFHDRDGLGYAGNDQYYRNSIYQNGWNHFYRSLGTPLITSPIYNVDGTIYTLNNRVQAHHLGIRGDIYGFGYRLLATYARNYGTDATSTTLLSTNTALLLELQRYVPQAWGLHFSLRMAADLGSQFGNSFGAMLTITKSGLLQAL